MINSAATDGVGALTSATKSEIVKSISCPIAETMGIGKDLIERAIDSVLNTERSSRDPPPRVISVTSGSGFMLVIFFRASRMLASADSPCTVAATTVVFIDGNRR